MTYASFGHSWTTYDSGFFGLKTDQRYFTYGLATPAQLLSGKTGQGTYNGVIYGYGSNSQSGATYDVRGTSQFNVNFGAQSYTAALNMNGIATSGGASNVNFGSFGIGGHLGYTQDTTADIMSGTDLLGGITFRFYGPDGEEIGGSFSAVMPQGNPGAGTSIQGVTVAKRP